jgi:prepilin-type N-terminal cleavage/methylation domain-containing protein
MADRQPRRRGLSLIEVIIVALVIAILTVIMVPMYLAQADKARDAATRTNVRTIQTAVLGYALDNGDTYPAATQATAEGLRSYADRWPANAWTGQPMASHCTYSRGDFAYQSWSTATGGSALSSTATVPAPRDTYGLVGYLGKPSRTFVVEPLPHADKPGTTPQPSPRTATQTSSAALPQL